MKRLSVLLLTILWIHCHVKAAVLTADTVGNAACNAESGYTEATIARRDPKNLPARWGYMLAAVPGKVLGLDRWARHELVDDNTFAVAGELRYTPQPGDDDSFAEDYDYPTFSVGFRYSFNHGTKLTRVVKDYNSVLGDVATIYGKFSRPVIRTRCFELAYYIGTGVGYSHRKYNTTDEVNNEFIGSRWNIFFTGGLSATYKIGQEWAVIAAIDYSHHSNGALRRPNKGSNYLGPLIGVAYSPQNRKQRKVNDRLSSPAELSPREHLYLELSAGLGAKTLLEDWFNTQQNPNSPKYRTSKFSTYGAFSMQTALMYRYARRWASGVGFDVFYSDYADKIERLDNINGHSNEKHSPWSVGLALKHEVFYGRFSARMGIGAYLYRHMGYVAHEYEGPKWLYERIGLFYTIPSLDHASIGFSVNAHVAKADFTELVISYPIKL